MRILVSLSAGAGYLLTKIKNKDALVFPKSKKGDVEKVQKLVREAFKARQTVMTAKPKSKEEWARVSKVRDEGERTAVEAGKLAKSLGLGALKLPIKGSTLYDYKPDPKSYIDSFGVRGNDNWFEPTFVTDEEFAELGGKPKAEKKAKPAAKKEDKKEEPKKDAPAKPATKKAEKKGANGPETVWEEAKKKYPDAMSTHVAGSLRHSYGHVPAKNIKVTKDEVHVTTPKGLLTYQDHGRYYSVTMRANERKDDWDSGPVDAPKAGNLFRSAVDKAYPS